MAARTTAIMEQIRATLASVGGLTGNGQVVVGEPTPTQLPNLSAVLYLSLGGLESSVEGPLGHYRREATFEIEAYVRPSAQTAQARTAAAVDLLDDVMAALEADRSLGGQVIDIIISGVAAPGQGSRASWGIVAAQVVAYWHAASGEGL